MIVLSRFRETINNACVDVIDDVVMELYCIEGVYKVYDCAHGANLIDLIYSVHCIHGNMS